MLLTHGTFRCSPESPSREAADPPPLIPSVVADGQKVDPDVDAVDDDWVDAVVVFAVDCVVLD